MEKSRAYILNKILRVEKKKLLDSLLHEAKEIERLQ